MRTIPASVVGSGAAVVLALASTSGHAAPVFCKNKRGGAVSVREATCKKSQVKLTLSDFGAAGPSGAPGTDGTAGADGQLRIYGNGSAGARTVSAVEDWTTTPETNLQFTDVTINAGAALLVPSGTIIRCTGTFTNHGTITVQSGARGGLYVNQGPNANLIEDPSEPAHPGVALRAAGGAGMCPNTISCAGTDGGVGLGAARSRALLRPGPVGGGGGGAAHFSNDAGDGGGSLVVLARTAIVNSPTGTINAPGAGGGTDSNGGGAGGVVILASPGSVTNAGAINAVGANGEDADTDEGASGGGGGGIVHLLAPVLSTTGTVDVSGGTGGSTATQITVTPRSSGAGGGACGGDGGGGGGVASGAAANSGAAGAGGTGQSLTSTLDPTALF